MKYKESACNAGDLGLIPGLGRSHVGGHGNSLQYSCLENSMNRWAWQAAVHGVSKSWTWLNDETQHSLPGSVQFSSVQSLICIRLFATPWTAAHQASLSITNSQSLLKLMSNWWCHLITILCHPLLLLPSIFPSIRVFENESVLCIRWPK